MGMNVSHWFDLETCSKVIEDGAIGQNTYDFLLVYYLLLSASLYVSKRGAY